MKATGKAKVSADTGKRARGRDETWLNWYEHELLLAAMNLRGVTDKAAFVAEAVRASDDGCADRAPEILVSVKLPKAEREKIDAAARSHGIDRAEVLRRFILRAAARAAK